MECEKKKKKNRLESVCLYLHKEVEIFLVWLRGSRVLDYKREKQLVHTAKESVWENAFYFCESLSKLPFIPMTSQLSCDRPQHFWEAQMIHVSRVSLPHLV